MNNKNNGQNSRKIIESLRKSGIVKLKEKDMFSIWVKTACSNLTSRQLCKLADITDIYARGYLLFSSRQIPIIPHIKWSDVEEVKKELSHVYLELDRCGPRVRNINVCYDDKLCPDALTNSIALAEKLENFFQDPILHKIKIGVAGCMKDCIISRVLNDISFIGMGKKGTQVYYDVYVGGRLGLKPFVGVKMARQIPENKAIKFVWNYFDLIRKEGKRGERSADLINRLGAEKVKHALNKDLQTETPFRAIECETKINENITDKIILRIRATCGEVTSIQLKRIADISEQYGKGIIHFGVRGSPEIPGVDKEYLEKIRNELVEVGLRILDQGIDNIQACFGEYCTESVAATQPLLRKIDNKVEELGLNNLNIKISAAGCPNSCGIAHLNDIGFLGEVKPQIYTDNCAGCKLCVPVCKVQAIEMKGDVAIIDTEICKHCGQCIALCPFDAIVEERKGFTILAGGKEGEDTRLGKVIAEFLSEEEALLITGKCLRLMKERDTSASEIIDQVGLEEFKDMLTLNTYRNAVLI